MSKPMHPEIRKAIDFLLKRPEVVCDTECYRDYWSIGFKNRVNGKKVIFEVYDGHPLDRQAVADIIRKYRVITFNGKHYDEHMIALAMAGASNATLKKASDDIIVGGLRPWQFADKYGAKMPEYFDHIDLMEIAPGVKISLKKYGARMNMPRLQELPIHPDELIGSARRPLMRKYLGNDLDTTDALAAACENEMTLRADLSDKHKLDLRSKSDAQIAEALIIKEVKRRTGIDLKKPIVQPGSFRYKAPKWLKFRTPEMQDLLDTITNTKFMIGADGICRLPKELEGRVVTLGGTSYKMGIGGLHSMEKRQHFVSNEDEDAIDADVRGYYPLTMLSCGFVPDAIGQVFIPIFKEFVRLRDEAKALAKKYKKLGDTKLAKLYKQIADGLKIVNNGTFGKTGSPFSVLWGPKLMIHVTITGQLALLMLIESLILDGFRVISANTDGLVTIVPKVRNAEFNDIIFDWECATQYVTEQNKYRGLYSRDVNNYFAIKEDGEVKTKGVFSPASVSDKHDPNGDICSEAAIAWVQKGVPIESTIRGCKDIRKFVFVRMATGGGFKDGEYLGKLVRWYHGVGTRTGILTAEGSQVAGTTGAVPCMDLPEEFPHDVDVAWYVREAWARVADTGLPGRDPNAKRREGYRYATLPGRKTVHIVNLFTERSLCDLQTEDVREPWQEQAHADKVCKKCSEAAKWRNLQDIQIQFESAEET